MTKVETYIKTSADYLREPYTRVLIPEEEGGYSAEILEFPGCYSQGETAEEAIQNVEEAARNWIEATLASGKPIPDPSSHYQYGGKIALRLPRSLHRQAMRLAERDGVSLNHWLTTAIAARVGAEDLCNRLAERVERSWISAALAADNRFNKVFAHLTTWVHRRSTLSEAEGEAGTDEIAPSSFPYHSQTTLEVRE